MTPKPENTTSYSLEPSPAYVNKGYVNNEKSSTCPAPTLEVTSTTTDVEVEKQPDGQVVQQRVIDFDDLLPHIGEFGRYQKILFLLMIPFAFFVAFVYFSQIFLTLVPDEHWCRVPELELFGNMTREERLELSIPKDSNGKFKHCSMYAVNFTEMIRNGVQKPNANWTTQECIYGWEYGKDEIPYDTIATENNWVCDNDHLPTLSQSIFFLGAICGGLLFGWIADRYGRIPALVGCNSIGFIAGVGTAFTANFWQFSLCRFLVGFAFDNCFTMMYILVLEYVGPKWRTFVANMSIAIFFTIASTALPWIAYYIADWRLLAIVTSAPLCLAVFTPFVVPESARWLVSQGRIQRAMKILRKFEKINKKEVSPQIYKDFSDSCTRMLEEETANSNYSLLDLFKTPRLRRITILLILIWMAISLVFDGHVRNVGQLGLDFFVTFTIAAATELPADTLLTLTLDRWGRRWLAFGTMVMSGVFSLLAVCVPVGIESATLAILGRFSVNISYNIGLQYAAELLPTVVRAQGVAFIHIMGYVASILAPFVVYLSHFMVQLPLIVLGVLGIIGGFLSLFLPETLNHDLPQSLSDGEEFGRGQGMWDFPCCQKTVDDDDEDEKNCGNFKRAQSIGQASLRASTRGEYQSSILRRSVYSSRAGASFRSINTKL